MRSSTLVPKADQVVIKVICCGCNPKGVLCLLLPGIDHILLTLFLCEDFKVPEWTKISMNQGDDIAGVVHSVGQNVTEFKPGDRVAAFHKFLTPHGSWAEYAVAWGYTTFHLPAGTSFEGARLMPLFYCIVC